MKFLLVSSTVQPQLRAMTMHFCVHILCIFLVWKPEFPLNVSSLYILLVVGVELIHFASVKSSIGSHEQHYLEHEKLCKSLSLLLVSLVVPIFTSLSME